MRHVHLDALVTFVLGWGGGEVQGDSLLWLVQGDSAQKAKYLSQT